MMKKIIWIHIVIAILAILAVSSCKKKSTSDNPLRMTVEEYYQQLSDGTIPKGERIEVELANGTTANVIITRNEDDGFLEAAPLQEKDKIVVNGIEEIARNQLVIKTSKGITMDQVKVIIAPYGGIIIGYSKFFRRYIVRVDSNDFKTLKKIHDAIKSNPSVKIITYRVYKLGGPR